LADGQTLSDNTFNVKYSYKELNFYILSITTVTNRSSIFLLSNLQRFGKQTDEMTRARARVCVCVGGGC